MWGPCCSPRRRMSLSSPSSARNVWSVAETRVSIPSPTLPHGPGKWEWGRRRERRGEGPAAGQASSQPAPWVRALRAGAAGRLLPKLPGSTESVTSAGLSWNPAWLGPGLRPCCWFKLCSQATRGFYSCTSCSILKTGPLYWSSLHLLLLDLGVPSFTMAEVQEWVGHGMKPRYE